VNFGDLVLQNESITDKFGRTIETRLYTGQGSYIATKKDLDALGRTKKAYNPGSSTEGTSYGYDELGRISRITYADGSQESFDRSHSLGDNIVDRIDPASKKRREISDALGRIYEVVEDPGTQGLNLTTSYTYDALDNLTTVTQGSQPQRVFAYNSLKQLLSAGNPEIGSSGNERVYYDYDANGNLYTKTMPDGLVTTYSYDELDRVITRSYSDNTAAVTYCYDGTSLMVRSAVAADLRHRLQKAV
jgi:YD repeat-containing protein